jgi:hypothetical protein
VKAAQPGDRDDEQRHPQRVAADVEDEERDVLDGAPVLDAMKQLGADPGGGDGGAGCGGQSAATGEWCALGLHRTLLDR